MKVLSRIGMILAMFVVAVWAGCTGIDTVEQQQSHQFTETDPERRDVLYTCSCGPQCKCNTVSTQTGRCACKTPLKWGHILKIEGSEVILCQCPEGCRCYGLDNRQYSCNCGLPIKRVDLKGTGIYFCNCGGSCYCNTVSDSPEKCRCGAILKRVD